MDTPKNAAAGGKPPRKWRPKVAPPTNLDPLQRYSLPETCAFLRISRTKLYQLFRTYRLSKIKDGAKSFVAGSEIARLSRP